MSKKKKRNGLGANREYKNSVFTLIFNDEERIKEIYGAIKNIKFGPETKVRLTTIKNILRGGRRNDLSFELDGRLVILIEHQSTLNQNMPLRMLSYIENLYSEYIKKEDIYSNKRVPLPFPEFIVLYNGTDEMEGELELRLSDAFLKIPGMPQPETLELVVKVYNINKGYNVEMAKRSPTLYGYETFIAMVRENEKSMELKKAIVKAVEECINQDVLRNFMLTHKKELIDMLVTEWDFDLEKKVLQKEAWEDGRVEGRVEGEAKGRVEGEAKGRVEGEARGKIEMAKRLKAKGIDLSTIVEVTELAVDEVLRL